MEDMSEFEVQFDTPADRRRNLNILTADALARVAHIEDALAVLEADTLQLLTDVQTTTARYVDTTVE